MSEANVTPTITTIGNSVTDSSEKVERIREILVGPYQREYTQKLEAAKREVVRLQQEVYRLNEQLQAQDSALRKLTQEATERLSTQLQEQDKRHTQLLQMAEQRQLEQLQEVEQRSTQQAQRLSEQIQHSERTLLAELSRLASQLNYAKADRTSLADLLIQLGSTLKTTEPAPVSKVTDLFDQLQNELQEI